MNATYSVRSNVAFLSRVKSSILAAVSLAALALCCAPATASAAVTRCTHGKNADQICINFNRTYFGNKVRIDSEWASIYQGSCGIGGNFHMDITVQSDQAVYNPPWQKLPGVNKWTIPGPAWRKFDTGADCWNGDADITVPFSPLPPDRIRLSGKLWPRGYYVCVVLWNYHGGTNYSEDAAVCART